MLQQVHALRLMIRAGMVKPTGFTRCPPSGRAPTTDVFDVPLIQVKLIENVFTAEQKQQIVRRLTDTLVEIEGENMRPVTWCVIEEVKSGDWAIAGNPLTTADVKALAAGVPA